MADCNKCIHLSVCGKLIYCVDNGKVVCNNYLETKEATSDENKRWIPIFERLPEKDVKVLTFGVYGFSVNYRDRFSGKWRGANGKPQWITHWMPLPEPPNEDN